jgi:hypothetical protein
VVHETFPIRPALFSTLEAIEEAHRLDSSSNISELNPKSNSNTTTKEKFPDQLDWWKNRGRWK